MENVISFSSYHKAFLSLRLAVLLCGPQTHQWTLSLSLYLFVRETPKRWLADQDDKPQNCFAHII